MSVCVFVFISFHHRGFFRLQWYRRHTWVYETSVLCYGGHDIGFFFQFDWYPVPFIFHPKRQNYDFAANWKENQYVKSVQIRGFFWSVFSRWIRRDTENFSSSEWYEIWRQTKMNGRIYIWYRIQFGLVTKTDMWRKDTTGKEATLIYINPPWVRSLSLA